MDSTEYIGRVTEELSKGERISIVSLVDRLIEYAHSSSVSDIHIDPQHTCVKIRVRIDGVLHHAFDFPKKIHSEIISRIKVLAQLRTDEHQTTQDGRFRHMFPNTDEYVDMRVSIIPTYHGENTVIRLLTDKAEQFTLQSLGFGKRDQKKITDALKKPSGMILSTGPTGSGKTTTLYTLIKMLNAPEVSIVTIEDPIEYAVSGIEQIQVNPRTGLSFADGLRSILRQDPNIIMVGEIRDNETAHIAVNTALTGHLLLSTLHTNDSATTLPRLLDMGIPEYLVASTVSIVIGQRLVRKICTSCRKEVQISDILVENLSNTLLEKLFMDNQIVYAGSGCSNCNETGFAGRISVSEVMVMDDEIREAIIKRTSASDIKKIAIDHGMTPMIEDGYEKIKNGLTTIEEILRVVHD